MLMRGGCLMANEMAADYDANRDRDVERVRGMFPSCEPYANEDMVKFEVCDKEGNVWTFFGVRSGMSWMYGS